MKHLILTLGVSAAVAAAALASPAFADRPATAEERATIGGILKSNGFTSWRKIEFDDGKFEVDDAVHADGRVYDVDIRGGSIVKKELED